MGSFFNLVTIIVISSFNFILVHQSVVLQQESEWEQILRELIFKTLSPSGLPNNNLYKQLLRAPIYRKSNFTSSSSPLSVSKGDVIFLPPNRWILCEENCFNCNECLGSSNPTIKWTLKRTKVSDTRYDLQITVTPQANASYRAHNLGPQSFVYIVSESKDRSAESTKYKQFEERNVLQQSNPPSEDICDDPNSFHSQLIMGTDDFGKKYLIQIVKSDIVQDKMMDDGLTKLLTSKGGETEISYANVLRCIVKSLNNRRKSIVQFLAPTPKSVPNLGSKRNLYIKWEDITFTNPTPEDEIPDEEELEREIDFRLGAEGKKFESLSRVAPDNVAVRNRKRDGTSTQTARRRNRWSVNPRGMNSTRVQKESRI